MIGFEPFDEQFNFDKSILTEEFPDYMLPSILKWIEDLLIAHNYYKKSYRDINDKFILSITRHLRASFKVQYTAFMFEICEDKSTLRNVLTYLLQNIANEAEGRELEVILAETSSAYAVDFKKERIDSGAISWDAIRMKLVYRVPPVVKEQAIDITRTNQLLAEAWESHYGIDPDDEKTVTRCTDALSGLLRDIYFPDEKKPQLGKLLKDIMAKPEKYPLPANSLYETEKFLSLMEEFSNIRGNHKAGTGRAPTHEEASFVLHFSIMLFQLLRGK